MTSKFYNYDNSKYNTSLECFSKVEGKVMSKKINILSKIKSKNVGYGRVKEFDIINECGWIESLLEGKEFYINPLSFFYNNNGITVLSLYPGERVFFEYSLENGIMTAITVWSCDGNEEKRNMLEEEAWEKYYEESGDCIWCGKTCDEENHEF